VSGGDFYEADDAIADGVFLNLVMTDRTAGSVNVSWSFISAP
jgi:hypothetical protein